MSHLSDSAGQTLQTGQRSESWETETNKCWAGGAFVGVCSHIIDGNQSVVNGVVHCSRWCY